LKDLGERFLVFHFNFLIWKRKEGKKEKRKEKRKGERNIKML